MTRRLEAGPILVTLGALLLLASLFLDWYEPGISAWEAFEAKVMELPRLAKHAVRFRRLYVSAAVECELDGSSRVLVPPHLRERIKLEKDALWAGMGRTLELWAKSSWEAALTMTADEETAFRAALEQLKI